MMRWLALAALLYLFTPLGDCLAQAPSEANGEIARKLYVEGKIKYAQGAYEESIAMFERAYALSEAPGLLFNLAQAHRLLGEAHCREAHSLYKTYLQVEPQAENRREVEERVAELAACASRPVKEEPALVVAAPEPPRSRPLPKLERRSLVAPILLSGVGAVLLIGGVVLQQKASARYDQAERECPCYPGTFSKWERRTRLGLAGMAVGGAALAAGASWWIAAAVDTPSRHASVVVGARF